MVLTTPELRMICISLGSMLDTDLNEFIVFLSDNNNDVVCGTLFVLL